MFLKLGQTKHKSSIKNKSSIEETPLKFAMYATIKTFVAGIFSWLFNFT